MAINDWCPNAISVIFHENIILFGHGSNFKSDDTPDIILRAKFVIHKYKMNRNIPQLHQFKHYLKTTFEADKCIAKLSMSHNKLVMDWHFFLQNAGGNIDNMWWMMLTRWFNVECACMCTHTQMHVLTYTHTQSHTDVHAHTHT